MLLKNKIEIEKWLNKYNIVNYELIPDDRYGYVVNVYRDVYLKEKNLKSIDIKFNIVNGYFDCSSNKLESLEGCPEIIYDDMYCFNNKLKEINYLPKEIKSDYINLSINPELDELQNIQDFNELKKILTIYQEKADLMKILEVTDKSVESTGLVRTVENLDLLIKNNVNKI